MCRDIGKVECAYRTVYQRNAVKQQSAGEECGKDVLGACLGRVVAVLVESHQRSHRDAGRFQSDEEHQEVAGGNHEVHTQQRGECQYIELALLDCRIGAAHPLVRHKEHDERTYAENGFDDTLYRLVMVHPAESVGCRTGNDGYKRMDDEQGNGQHGVQHRLAVVLVRIRTHEEVGYEEDNDNRYQRQLFFH